MAVEMVDLSLRIYHHFDDNLDAFAAKAAVFQSIFGLDLSENSVTDLRPTTGKRRKEKSAKENQPQFSRFASETFASRE